MYNKPMFIVGIFSWWYGAGWRQRAVMVRERIASSMDYFSIDLLLKTFFSPFRQISAGRVDGPIGVKFRAFLDRLISRIIGALVRTLIIGIGLTTIIFQAILGLSVLALWALIPLFPVIGLILSIFKGAMS